MDFVYNIYIRLSEYIYISLVQRNGYTFRGGGEVTLPKLFLCPNLLKAAVGHIDFCRDVTYICHVRKKSLTNVN